jgi:feruloyl esterase
MSAVMAALPMTGHRASFQMSRRTGSVIKDLSAGRAEAPFLFTGVINTHVQEGEPMKSLLTGIATATALLVAAPVAAQAAGQTCESLASLALPNTTITLARAVDAGSFTIPIAAGGTPAPTALVQAASGLPAFCRVAATLKPSTDSDIKIEVWMPASGWNGKFMAAGNGGWSGSINYAQMVPILKRGYAVASTDTGHESSGQDASWAMGHPEKQIDFGYRAVHEMTLRAKEIQHAFYGDAPRFAYWNSCSSGGRQGLKEAQRFPTDYDGIIAGAPANYWTHQMTQVLGVARAVQRGPATLIPPSKYPLIHDAALRQCDALDGVKDGLLEDPRRCAFDPAVLQCKGADGPTCLTPPQVAALKHVYAPARGVKGIEIFPGFAVGGELGWGALPPPFGIAESHYKYIVFGDPNWNFLTLDVDGDFAKAGTIDAAVGQFNATDPDLSAFKQRGGKILQYHGWNDQFIAPQSSVNYYESVVTRVGNRRATEDFYRLFMVPGMMHCQGGEGATDQFDKISALEQWVEHGIAPDRIVASHVKDSAADRTRPLCPYPQVAEYKGTGSTDEAANFICKTP